MLDAHLFLLQRTYPGASIRPEGFFQAVLIPSYVLPVGFDKRLVNARVVMPVGYPFQAPDSVYVDPSFAETNPLPVGAEFQEVSLGKKHKEKWLRIPVNIQKWDGRTYNLGNFLFAFDRLMTRSLERGSTS